LKSPAQEDDGDSDEEARQARVIQRRAERTAAERPAFFTRWARAARYRSPTVK